MNILNIEESPFNGSIIEVANLEDYEQVNVVAIKDIPYASIFRMFKSSLKSALDQVRIRKPVTVITPWCKITFSVLDLFWATQYLPESSREVGRYNDAQTLGPNSWVTVNISDLEPEDFVLLNMNRGNRIPSNERIREMCDKPNAIEKIKDAFSLVIFHELHIPAENISGGKFLAET